MPCIKTCIFAALAFLSLLAPSQARYMRPDLIDVPIGRIISNLEAGLKENPKDVEALHHLARAHAMAYVKRLKDTDTVQQNPKRSKDGLWFGYGPKFVPYAPYKPEPTPANAKAKAHLDQAIATYDRLLALGPEKENLIRLGRAWCAMKAEKTAEAVKDLRTVIETAWSVEGKRKSGGLGNFVVVEAAGYLKPLLDPKKDAQELATLDERVKYLQSLPRAITPLAIPLVKGLQAADLVDAQAKVSFDLDGSGENRAWQWLNPTHGAWLVHDPRATGSVTSALQLFGSRSFNLFVDDGYAALRLLDNNRDGLIAGSELNGLALWHDSNANGISEKGEVRPVSQWKIRSLACTGEPGTDGVLTHPKGVTFQDGSTRPSWDLILETAP